MSISLVSLYPEGSSANRARSFLSTSSPPPSPHSTPPPQPSRSCCVSPSLSSSSLPYLSPPLLHFPLAGVNRFSS